MTNAVAQVAYKSKMLCLKTVYYSRELLTEDICVPPTGAAPLAVTTISKHIFSYINC